MFVRGNSALHRIAFGRACEAEEKVQLRWMRTAMVNSEAHFEGEVQREVQRESN